MLPIQTLGLAAVTLLLTSRVPLLPAPNFPLPTAVQVVRDSPTERLPQRKAEAQNFAVFQAD